MNLNQCISQISLTYLRIEPSGHDERAVCKSLVRVRRVLQQGYAGRERVRRASETEDIRFSRARLRYADICDNQSQTNLMKRVVVYDGKPDKRRTRCRVWGDGKME